MNDMEWYPYLKHEDQPLPLPTGADIKALEDRLDVIFPLVFRNTLTRHQGQIPERYIALVGHKGEVPLRCLNHVFLDDIAPGQSIYRSYLSLKNEGLERKLIPFSDSGNSYFCLDYSKSNTEPAVVLLVGDYEFDDHRAVVHISDSFQEFLDVLMPDE